VLQVAGAADALGLPEARAKVDSILLPALFSRLHEVAREQCTDKKDNAFLADILTGGHLLGHPVLAFADLPCFSGRDKESLQREYQLCGSSIVVQTEDCEGEVIDEATLDEQNPTNNGFLNAPADGFVVIRGDDLMDTHCGDQLVHRPPVRARAIRSGSTSVLQLGELGSPLETNVETIANALDLPESGTFEIVVERFGTPYDLAAIGPAQMELFRITLNQAAVFPISCTGSWGGSCEDEEGPFGVSGSFQLTISAGGTVAGSYSGSASRSISGTVDEDGTLNANASGSAGACTWQGTLRFDCGGVSGSGTWNCGDGVSGGDWSFGGGL
jgi:hypothetical protein